MQKPVILYEPRFAEPSALSSFIFAEIGLVAFAVLFLFAGLSPFFAEIAHPLWIILGLYMLLLVPYTIYLRFTSYKKRIIIDEQSITFELPELAQRLLWSDVERVYIAPIVYMRKNNAKEGFLYLFVKLKRRDSLITSIPGKKSGRLVHFVAVPEDLRTFLGPQASFDLALYTSGLSDESSEKLVHFIPGGRDALAPLGPFVEVASVAEYNDVVRHTYERDKAEKLLLPEVTTSSSATTPPN